MQCPLESWKVDQCDAVRHAFQVEFENSVIMMWLLSLLGYNLPSWLLIDLWCRIQLGWNLYFWRDNDLFLQNLVACLLTNGINHHFGRFTPVGMAVPGRVNYVCPFYTGSSIWMAKRYLYLFFKHYHLFKKIQKY